MSKQEQNTESETSTSAAADVMRPSKEQAKLLRHMLGIDKPWERNPEPYRNHAAVTPGGKQYQEFCEMRNQGLVYLACEKGECYKDYDLWRCTDAGKDAAIESHKDIRYSKAKRRYRKFLDIADTFPNLTFKQFLTDPSFEEVRKAA